MLKYLILVWSCPTFKAFRQSSGICDDTDNDEYVARWLKLNVTKT